MEELQNQTNKQAKKQTNKQTRKQTNMIKVVVISAVFFTNAVFLVGIQHQVVRTCTCIAAQVGNKAQMATIPVVYFTGAGTCF